MKQAGVALIPTLKLWPYEFRHEPFALGSNFTSIAEGQLKAWRDTGGTVLFGTDVGYMSDYDPREEYELMAAAGMGFRDILASLTTAPSTKFGESARLGRIAVGLAADLTVLGDDPSRDVHAFTSVQYTLRDGNVIYQRPANYQLPTNH